MSAYLARLKQLENGKNSYYASNSEPTKPSKAPFVGFDGTGTGHNEKKIIDSETPKPDNKQDQQQAVRRQKVIALLESAPGTQRAVYVDDASDPENITLTIAVRHPAGATCEMLIPRSKYDSWKFLELLERLGQTTH